MSDLLWSDPQPFPGRSPSKRGVGLNFGPDVTERFLNANDLCMLIRSHEVKDEGYVVEHGGLCVTVFSAPNYCDSIGNKGAVCRLNHAALSKPTFLQFSAVPHPPIRPSESGPRALNPPPPLFFAFLPPANCALTALTHSTLFNYFNPPLQTLQWRTPLALLPCLASRSQKWNSLEAGL